MKLVSSFLAPSTRFVASPFRTFRFLVSPAGVLNENFHANNKQCVIIRHCLNSAFKVCAEVSHLTS